MLYVIIVAVFLIPGCSKSSNRKKSNPQLEKKAEFYLTLIENVPDSRKDDYRDKLATVYEEMGKMKKAQEYKTKPYEVSQKNYTIDEMAMGYSPDYYKNIIQYCDSFIANNPKAAYAYLEEAFSHMALHNTDKAFKIINEAIDIDSLNVDAYILRSSMYRRIDQNEKARIDEQRAVKLAIEKAEKGN